MSTDSIFTEVVNFVKLTMSTMDLIGFAIFLHYIYKNPVLLSKMLNRYIFLLAIFNLLSVILATAKDLIEFESNTSSRNSLKILSSVVNIMRGIIFNAISVGCLMRRYGRDTYKKWSKSSIIFLLTAIAGVTICAIIIVPVLAICQHENLMTCIPKYAVPIGTINKFVNGGIHLWLVIDLIIRKQRRIRKWTMDKWNAYNNNVVEIDPEEVEEKVEIQVYNLKDWNEVKQQQQEENTKELAGVITMCLTLFFNSIIGVIHLNIGTEESEPLRGFIKTLASLATISLWNFMNEELWNHSKVCIQKPLKKIRNLCHFM